MICNRKTRGLCITEKNAALVLFYDLLVPQYCLWFMSFILNDTDDIDRSTEFLHYLLGSPLLRGTAVDHEQVRTGPFRVAESAAKHLIKMQRIIGLFAFNTDLEFTIITLLYVSVFDRHHDTDRVFSSDVRYVVRFNTKCFPSLSR